MSDAAMRSGAAVGMTFILPVLNRSTCIVRAVESCLACATDRVAVRVLVIDGGSSDSTQAEVTAHFSGDARVELLDQPAQRKGFMGACFFGVERLDTELATFMYSDDVLSPEIGSLAEALSDQPDAALALGYGQQAGENDRVAFRRGLDIRNVPAAAVMDAFYGRVDRLDGRSLPVSPVCCVVRADTMRSWAGHVGDFVGDSALRHHAMIRLAGGQDLMVYLNAILESGGRVLVADGVVAQLTASKVSITNAGNLAGQLLMGYWLARVWGMYQSLEKMPARAVTGLAGYVLAVWLYIVFGCLGRFDFHWLGPVMCEGWQIVKRVIRSRIGSATFASALYCTWLRIHPLAKEEK